MAWSTRRPEVLGEAGLRQQGIGDPSAGHVVQRALQGQRSYSAVTLLAALGQEGVVLPEAVLVEHPLAVRPDDDLAVVALGDVVECGRELDHPSVGPLVAAEGAGEAPYPLHVLVGVVAPGEADPFLVPQEVRLPHQGVERRSARGRRPRQAGAGVLVSASLFHPRSSSSATSGSTRPCGSAPAAAAFCTLFVALVVGRAVDELHVAGTLVAGQPATHVAPGPPRSSAPPRPVPALAYDAGQDGFSPLSIRHAHQGDVGDTGNGPDQLSTSSG